MSEQQQWESFNQAQPNDSQPMHADHPAQPYKFTPDELRTLRECNRESFYYRCLPFSTFLGAGTYFAVKAGYLSSNPRLGPIPKVMASCIFGYFVGKFSYQEKCIEKLMKLPNSELATMLKKKKGILPNPAFQEIFSTVAQPTPTTAPADYQQQFTDVGDTLPMNSFDSDSNIFGAVDYKDNESQMNEDKLVKTNKVTTYDELRMQNRRGFEQGGLQGLPPSSSGQRSEQQQQQQQMDDQQQQQQPVRREAQGSQPNKKKNIYGDVWDG